MSKKYLCIRSLWLSLCECVVSSIVYGYYSRLEHQHSLQWIWRNFQCYSVQHAHSNRTYSDTNGTKCCFCIHYNLQHSCLCVYLFPLCCFRFLCFSLFIHSISLSHVCHSFSLKKKVYIYREREASCGHAQNQEIIFDKSKKKESSTTN